MCDKWNVPLFYQYRISKNILDYFKAADGVYRNMLLQYLVIIFSLLVSLTLCYFCKGSSQSSSFCCCKKLMITFPLFWLGLCYCKLIKS